MRGSLFGTNRPGRRARTKARGPRMERLEERQLLAIFTVTNVADSGPGSLRQAIINSNQNGGPDRIEFAIPGSGVHTIIPGVAPDHDLPTIIDAVTIDGTTQPGFLDKPLIEIAGQVAGNVNGLRIAAGGTVIQSLAINRFNNAGIRIEANNVTVYGCFIGTDPAGSAAQPNVTAGIFINNGSTNHIGGPDARQGNVLSGNTGPGLVLAGNSSSNVIQGNFLGMTSAGSAALANSAGITITGGGSNLIGGPFTNQGNFISGNTGDGVSIGANSRNNTIQGNIIGASQNGTIPVGNGGHGISVAAPFNRIGGTSSGMGNVIVASGGNGIDIARGADNTTIQGNTIGTNQGRVANLGNDGDGIAINASNVVVGGTLTGAANAIAYNGKGANGGSGVYVGPGVGNQYPGNNPILSNQFYGNADLGIDLDPRGSTPNDLGDNDVGPNGLQNFPVLSQASTGAGRTLVQGSLSSQPGGTYLIQFYSNTVGIVGGITQGRTLIGSQTVTADGSGTATINALLAVPTVVGEFVTATATSYPPSPTNETSEFSQGIRITQAKVADVTIDLSDTSDPATLGTPFDYVVNVTNRGPDLANNVRFTLTLPPNLTYIPSTPPTGVTLTPTGSGVLGVIPSIAANTSVRVNITVRPDATGFFTAQVSVQSNEIDTDSSNNSDSESTTVSTPSDVAAFLSQDPAPGVAGHELTYVAIVKNQGPGTASGIQLTTDLPANTRFVKAAAGQGVVQQVGGQIVADVGTLANGGVVAVRITVIADDPGTYPMTVHVTANEIDPDTSNNFRTFNAAVLGDAELRVTGNADRPSVVSGDEVTYTYNILNDGPSDATNVLLSGTFNPAAFDLVSATTSTGQVLADGDGDGKISTTLATVGALGSESLTLKLRARGDFTGITGVTAEARTTDQADLAPSDNAFTIRTPINPAELSITVVGNPNPALIGSQLTYTILVHNAGPAIASNVVVESLYTPTADFVSASGAAVTSTSGKSTFTIPTVAPGETVGLEVVIVPRQSGNIGSVARITSTGSLDTDSSNNQASVVVPVSPADVAVTLTASADSIRAGDTLRYDAVVTNNGPLEAPSVAFVNKLPAGVRFVSASTTKGTIGNSGSDVSAQLGTLASGESVRIVIEVIPITGGTLLSKADVGSTAFDSNDANNHASATVQATNAPGVLQFPTGLFVVNEADGSAQVTVNRVGGTQGTVSVRYKTTAGSAVAGTNFTSAEGTLTFQDGEISKTITIPILRDGVTTGPLAFTVALSDPTGGASLGGQAASTVGIVNADIDAVAPIVANVTLSGPATAITGVTLAFSEALNPATASYAPNFAIVAPDGSRPQLLPPVYDPVNHTVTLTPTTPLAPGVFYYVVVNSQGFAPVQDLSGNPIDGDGNGLAGGDFVVSFARGPRLSYADADGDLVNLALSRGSYLEMIRGLDGNARSLRIVGPVRGTSVLTGNVRRGGLTGDGVTPLGVIEGFAFGGVRSRLTTPPFYSIGQAAGAPVVLNTGAVFPRATPARQLSARRFSL